MLSRAARHSLKTLVTAQDVLLRPLEDKSWYMVKFTETLSLCLKTYSLRQQLVTLQPRLRLDLYGPRMMFGFHSVTSGCDELFRLIFMCCAFITTDCIAVRVSRQAHTSGEILQTDCDVVVKRAGCNRLSTAVCFRAVVLGDVSFDR